MSFRPSDLGAPFRHVVSLGCRCSQAATFKVLQQRRYACPFDWIFSSAKMVTHCLRDDFAAFLDRSQYYLNATVFDAIGLPPGSAPRDRNLIGHSLYSEMTEGVGRGVIFNHRDPLNNEEDYIYTQRAVERFRHVVACRDRKMFAVMNLDKRLWIESDLRELFEELCKRSDNFVLIAVDCIKNLGNRAHGLDIELFAHEQRGGAQMLFYRFPCAGDNTGSYFRDDFDAARIRTILVEPFRFALAEDPLLQEPHRAPRAPAGVACSPPAAVVAAQPQQQQQQQQQQQRGCWGRRGPAGSAGAEGEGEHAGAEAQVAVATSELATGAGMEDECPVAEAVAGGKLETVPQPVRRWGSRRARPA
mmetsp:Transcript_89053/g.247426  ORF Transcript_89053/g.247426 Transcript_89053/m.247426 type:complete len:360 (-) Transcript_89053:58-1137(-)